jgi:hypothetical protein
VPLTLVDYPVITLPAQLNGAPGSVLFPQVPQGYLWRIDALAVAVLNCTVNVSVLVYDKPPAANVPPLQGTTTRPYIDFSTDLEYSCDFDDQGSPITIQAGGQLVVTFGGNNGTVGLVRAQYGLYQGTAGVSTPVAGAQPGPPISPGL